MGGAMLHASLAFGPIKAWLDAAFDVLVNFHPLHYIVNFSISVGVEFDIDVWFIHIHLVHPSGQTCTLRDPILAVWRTSTSLSSASRSRLGLQLSLLHL